MPSPIWEDIDLFLQLDDFAVPAVIHLQGGGTISLSVIFDDPYVGAQAREYTHDTRMPIATCKESLVAAVARGDRITITFPAGAKQYDILSAAQSDGTGIATLELSP